MNSKDRRRLSEKAHLPLDKPFDRLTVLSSVEASKGCVTLISRHCGVLLGTPGSSGFVRAPLGLPTLRAGPQFRPAAKPAGWTFSISL